MSTTPQDKKQYLPIIISLFIALYSLPFIFVYPVASTIDGAWSRMMNLAIENGQFFGRDYVFTYGPLGFLSTRVGLAINHVWFYCFDLFLVAGFWYFIARFMAVYKQWFWYILLFLPLLLVRTSNYSQVLFLLNAIFLCFPISSDYDKEYEGIYCSITTILLFYIKINYGLISVVLLLVITGHAMLRGKRKFALYTLVSAVASFTIIYLSVNIDLGAYLYNSMELVRNYEAALALPVKYPSLAIFAFILAAEVLVVIALSYDAKKHKGADNYYLLVGILSIVFVLFVKNGFTRFDYTHWWDFFAITPIYMMVVLYFLRSQNSTTALCVAVMSLLLGFLGTFFHDAEGKSVGLSGDVLESISKTVSLKGYFIPTEDDYGDRLPCDIIPGKRSIIGSSSVDIFPFDDVQMAAVNNLNYKPRPVLHSYSVYTPHLDSLNAAYFKDPARRPGFVIIQNFSFDQHYPVWEESITKATIALNYRYTDFIELTGDSLKPFSYLVLKNEKTANSYPVFTDLYSKKTRLNETVQFSFADTDAIYMKAEAGYNAWGSLKAILLKSPKLNITLLVDDGRKFIYQVPLPLIKEPILINKLMPNSVSLRDFFAHHLEYSRNITGIMFSTNDAGFSNGINVSFMKLDNYSAGPR